MIEATAASSRVSPSLNALGFSFANAVRVGQNNCFNQMDLFRRHYRQEFLHGFFKPMRRRIAPE